jgi:hypothetical protein
MWNVSINPGTTLLMIGLIHMETVLEFLLGIGGLVLAGLVIAFVIGWYILASRAKKLGETT